MVNSISEYSPVSGPFFLVYQISNEPKNQSSTQENAPPKKQKIVVKEKLDKTELQKLYAALLTDPQNVKKAKEDYFDKLLKNHI